MRHHSMVIRRLSLPLAAMSLGMIAACGSTPSATPSGGAAVSAAAEGTTINLVEMNVQMQNTFKPGKYTFTISNHGTVPHELLVFSSTLAPENYPVASTGAINEEGSGITKVSDGDNLNPGQSQNREIDLTKPGQYLFVCNLPGHFASHMYTTVTVAA